MSNLLNVGPYFLLFLFFKKLHQLIGNKNIIKNFFPKYKSTLDFRDNKREKNLEPISNNLKNQLVNYIS